MAGKIPDETIQAIRDRISIVEVISSYVTLKKSGRNHLGLCPFHNEKTPSFTVNEERGLFHCFGCGVGGTVFNFVMRMERQEFPEAVATLARRAGVSLPERRESGPGAQHRERLLAVNNLAMAFFRHVLQRPEGERARRYLGQRGVSPEMIERFGLGFAPGTGTALVRVLANRKMDVGLAVELGLVGRSADGRLYDRFRGRVMFPIRHSDGRVLGFGGRALDGDGPKYLNSPESVLFRKGEGLYGLFEARQAIRDVDRVVLVEGYLDAVALVQAGIEHTVATLGTALTVAQLRLVRRFSTNVIAFFDGDAAGQKAAQRAFAVCAEAGVWALGAFLPDGLDPDSFVRERGAEATRTLLSEAMALADFYLDRIDPGPQAPVPERARAAAEIARVLAHVKDPFEYDLLVKQAAERLGISEQTLRQPSAAPRAPTMASATPAKTTGFPVEEALLVEAMSLDREVAVWAEHSGVLPRLRSGELAAAAQAILDAWRGGDEPATLVDSLPPAIATRITAGLLGEGPVASADRMKIATDCVARIVQRAQRELKGAVTDELRQAEKKGYDAQWREKLERRKELMRREGGRT